MANYFPPEPKKDAFNCPYCGVYAHQTWHDYVVYGDGTYTNFYTAGTLKELSVSKCSHCGNIVIWDQKNMLKPAKMAVPDPSEDVPKDIKEIYIEAGKVLIYSARASGALMRLALELLLQQINKNDLKLNENVNKMKESNISGPLIKALTILRVNGNDIMHTGVINIFEKKEDITYLFDLFNMIVEELITRPKKLDESYSRIPESKRKQAENMK